MPRTDDLHSLPPGLPVPVDDGACAHLPGAAVPPVALVATTGERVVLSRLPGRTVVFCYPRTGLPDRDPPRGWDDIPGARGCTPQSCAYRDRMREFRGLGVRVFGLSTQTTEYQREAADRLHLSFPLLSDEWLELARALRLPTFEIESQVLLKRATLVIRDGRIERVFYPVFPPDRDAAQVQAWLEEHPGGPPPAPERMNGSRPYEIRKGLLLLTTDRDRLDLAMIHGFLEGAYWSPRIALDTVRRAIEHSLAFGVFDGARQIAFARVISDYATFVYLADVFVLEEFRGRGIADWMLEGITAHPALEGMRTWLLATRDAHGLYARHGFVPLPHSERWMRMPAEPDHETARRLARERAGEGTAPR
jgi:peroxiredoxin/predicted N-acetyltransferase YhbS